MSQHLITILANLRAAAGNPHVAWPVVGAAALSIAAVWFPTHAAQLEATSKILGGYGVLSAATSGPSQPDTPK